MITLSEIQATNNVNSLFKKYYVHQGNRLDNELSYVLEERDPKRHRTYDFDIYLPTFGINLQRPYVWRNF